jgi:hypothetical protein
MHVPLLNYVVFCYFSEFKGSDSDYERLAGTCKYCLDCFIYIKSLQQEITDSNPSVTTGQPNLFFSLANNGYPDGPKCPKKNPLGTFLEN